MLIKRPDDVLPSEITPESVYHSRRQFMRGGATLAAGAALVACEPAESGVSPAAQAASDSSAAASSTPAALEYAKAPADGSSGFNTTETPTPFTDVIRYNNFYEFGTDKGDPARYGHKLTTTPWTVAVSGEVGKPGRYDFDDLIKPHQLQERIYRLRCVEAWSMVIPWVGIPLADVIKRMEPTGDAKYVAFETLKRPAEMRGQRSRTGSIDWPYEEGLRMDEAMHPLTLLAVGLYGKELLPQNGAPIRLVVPWKYGFKSIKSIVKIKLTKRKPATSWSQIAPREYGFYANVNPDVDHPRWSQASERRLPSTLFAPNRIDTQPFNGYAEQVASLYSGMDLRRNY